MSFTTDPNDPRLGKGVDKEPILQHEVYLVLSDDERAKGFVRPVRASYVHTGIQPKYPTRELTEEEKEKYSKYGYVLYEEYPESDSALNGRYWTKSDLQSGCGIVTTMGQVLAETYARDPKFYGATYCVGCQKHLPVEEFTWDKTNEKVGS